MFELVDQAVDFVLSKVNRAIGTRSESPQAPRTYEIPEEVVTEAVVNAVAHRDYTSNGSVQVMLFADRLEVWNPGSLPPPLTFEKLRAPHASVPANPLLAESMYLVNYVERMGTGTLDMIRRCVAAGLPEPEFTVTDVFVARVWRSPLAEQIAAHVQTRGEGRVTGQVEHVTDEVIRLLQAIRGDHSRQELQSALNLKSRANFEARYLKPAVDAGYIEMLIPDKPRSRLQNTG